MAPAILVSWQHARISSKEFKSMLVETLMFLLPRPRRELAFVLAPTQRRAPPREMAPPRGRRRDQPRASGRAAQRGHHAARMSLLGVPLPISLRSPSPILAATFMPPRGRPSVKRKERKQTTQAGRDAGWEDGTPPPHRDFKTRKVAAS